MKRLLIIVLIALLVPCCTRPTLEAEPKASAYKNCRIADVPHVRQKPDFCGEACAEMFLRKLGHAMSQDYVFNQSGVDPILGRGCHTAELAVALRKIGFKVGDVWYSFDADKSAREIEKQWAALHADLVKGNASIVCCHYEDKPATTEHFRLVVGYDADKDAVLYHEPAEANGAYRSMDRKLFLKLWPLKRSDKESLVIRFRLDPGEIKKEEVPDGFTPADYAQHVMALKTKLPAGFSFLIQPPFVVVGDDTPERVRVYAVRTIKWAVDRLKLDYFKKDPADIIDVWLFKDKESYEKHTAKIFGDKPSTPFGYYSDTHRALIMNIATGGGTLVHEIVHPFMAANFPGCPPWLNEGLGSLYEQCGDKDGRIYGYTNWRLAGLQKAVRAKEVPGFKELTGYGDLAFYSGDKGTNYAQARYLCYYLQEKGLLVKFYRDFHAARKTDPTGYETLKKTLGEEDMDAFKERWEEFVLKLRFPEK